MSNRLSFGRRLADGSTGLVTRRTALIVALAAALGGSIVSLAGGVALGAHWNTPAAQPHSTQGSVERNFEIESLGRMNASIAQLEPRLARLSTQVDALRGFDARLTASRGRSVAAPAGAPVDTEGAGGPLMPPRPCRETLTHGDVARDAQTTSEQIACIAQTLAALEDQTARHENTMSAFPNRNPAPSARVGSPFGNRADPFTGRLSFHPGVDLVGPIGTPILAAAGGRVSFAGQKSGYGNVVEITHGNGLVTRYGHASRIFVRVGQRVLPGDEIAAVGSTGRSTGPHLHFEVLVNGTAVDPMNYLASNVAHVHG